MTTPLTATQIETRLLALTGWAYTDGSLIKTFVFKDFRAAMAFLLRLAFEAEALNHHPEIFNIWNRVQITLRTHDAGNQVTDLDFTLAQRIEACI